MTQYWALQDAKAHLSELVKKAQKQGPQYISVRGEPSVVVMAHKKYQSLVLPKISIVEFFQKSPLVGIRLNLVRDRSPNRDVDL